MFKKDGLSKKDHKEFRIGLWMEDDYGVTRKYSTIIVLVPSFGVTLEKVKEELKKVQNEDDDFDGSIEYAFDTACDKHGWEWDYERESLDWEYDFDNNCDLDY